MNAVWIIAAFVLGIVLGYCIGLFNGAWLDKARYDGDDIDDVGGN